MLNKVANNYAAAYKKLSFVRQQEMINIFLALFYGGREELISRLTHLKKQSDSDQEIFEIIKSEINLDFWLQATEIIQFENITGLIKAPSMIQNCDELFNLIEDHQGVNRMFEIQKPFAQYMCKTVFDIELQGKSSDECKELTKAIAYVTKEIIAKEFGCNKRTLSKWLKIHFGDKFSRNDRKITINEYIEIFEAFFLSDDESMDLNNNLDKYLKRVRRGMSFSKSELAELCFSDLKTQKQNLKKIAYYSSINKFPYSILKDLTQEMGSDLEF